MFEMVCAWHVQAMPIFFECILSGVVFSELLTATTPGLPDTLWHVAKVVSKTVG